MFRRLVLSLNHSRGFANKVDVKWVRPEYVPSYKPQKSGDLEPLPVIPDDALGKDYALCEEIKDAPENVRKLFTVPFLGAKQHNLLAMKKLMDRVRRHKYDDSTLESKIAKLTGVIRVLQINLEKRPGNVRVKVIAQELIDKRKKLLKFLRQTDYKRFEWVLEQLNIEYKPQPEDPHKKSRKESLRKLTEMYCDDIREKKLDEYKKLLESQQGPFLKDKLKTLKFIRSEQIDLHVPITVNEQDIKIVERQLEQWTIRDEIKQQAKKRRKSLISDYE